MGTYLEDYLESMYMLPSEIKRNFDLMRELDKTSYPLIEELKTAHKAFLIEARAKVVARCADTSQSDPDEAELRALVAADPTVAALHATHQRVVQKLDEKIAIAAQSYDIVDHHIRRLDQDLEVYAAQLRQSGEFEDDLKPTKKHKSKHASGTNATNATASHSAAAHAHNAPLPLKSSKQTNSDTKAAGHATTSSSTSGGKGATNTTNAAATTSSRKRSAAAAELAVDIPAAVPPALPLLAEDLPIDPNEPIYCDCRRVSYGQMVGCDNDDCKYEWFHFECVGLTDQPSGTWYCNECKVLLGIK